MNEKTQTGKKNLARVLWLPACHGRLSAYLNKATLRLFCLTKPYSTLSFPKGYLAYSNLMFVLDVMGCGA